MPDDDAPKKPARKFIVDRYLPAGFMHLLAAPVGMGKTTIVMQLIKATETEQLWFSERTHKPTGVLFISADRDREETEETLERMGIAELQAKFIFTCDYTVVPHLELIIERHSAPGWLVIVEPFMVFLRDGENRSGNINDYNQVFNFANRVKRIIRKCEVTLLGTGHSAKAKKGEGYNLVRERTLGSTAWSGAFNTIIYIDPTDTDDQLSPLRTITIFPRNKPGVQIECVQEGENGLIVPITQKIAKSPLDIALAALVDPEFTYTDACKWATSAGKTEKTAERWLREQIKENGRVVKLDRGVYKRVDPS